MSPPMDEINKFTAATKAGDSFDTADVALVVVLRDIWQPSKVFLTHESIINMHVCLCISIVTDLPLQ